MRERHVGIVGGGFCGTLAAIHLLRAPGRLPLCITVVEQGGNVGPGVAYSTRDPDHLLNVPASRMSAFDDDASHFFRFAVLRDPSVTPATFVRRSLYGEYLTECLAFAERVSRHRLLRRTGEVTNILRSTRGHRIALSSGQDMFVDATVLGVGAVRRPRPGLIQSFGSCARPGTAAL
jgi:uncharacterized NAD(P)/FAD-binding protein YdhS